MAVEVLSPKDCLMDSLSRQSVTNFNRNPNPSCLGRPSRPQPDGKNRRPNRPNNLPRPVQKFPPPPKPCHGSGQNPQAWRRNPQNGAGSTTTEAKFQAPSAGSAATEAESQTPSSGSRKHEPDGPGNDTLSKQADPNRTAGFYAGSSSCIASPPPSSLPLPSFFAKKGAATSTDAAASELLKLLRLNL